MPGSIAAQSRDAQVGARAGYLCSALNCRVARFRELKKPNKHGLLLVLPDRIELRPQSCLMLILLGFSVRRSVFVWHSWVTLLPRTRHWPRLHPLLVLALPTVSESGNGRAHTSATPSAELFISGSLFREGVPRKRCRLRGPPMTKDPQANSAVVGSIKERTRATLFAGKPPFWACARTAA